MCVSVGVKPLRPYKAEEFFLAGFDTPSSYVRCAGFPNPAQLSIRIFNPKKIYRLIALTRASRI